MSLLYRVAAEDEGSGDDKASTKEGRWNSADIQVWYASESIALAMLEVLQSNYQDVSRGIRHICCIEVSQEAFSLRVKGPRELLREDESRRFGTEWARNGTSLLLEVPSYLVPWEKNFIVNSAHPEFVRIKVNAIGHLLPDGRACRRTEDEEKP